METKKCFLPQVIFSLSVILLLCNFAQAETINCTAIPSVPYTISSQGVYCLTSNLSTNIASGNAITINANNVVLDLNGYKIGGLAAGLGTGAHGIYASQRQNITIRNGTVRGFYYGIWLDDVSPYTTSQGHIIEDIRADMNTFTGLQIAGRGNIIRNNQVVDTGGSSAPFVDFAYGISVFGPGNRVINNDVYETKEEGSAWAYGIHAHTASGVVIGNNRVGNAELGPAFSFGVYMVNSTNAMVKDNTISLMTHGIFYDLSAPASTGIYMNNLTSGCTTPFTGGTAAGSTNYHQP